MQLPEDFVRETKQLMGEARFNSYLEAFHEEAPVSIRMNVTKEPSLCYIQADAHWGLLFECLQVAIEACLTHQLPRSPYKILR